MKLTETQLKHLNPLLKRKAEVEQLLTHAEANLQVAIVLISGSEFETYSITGNELTITERIPDAEVIRS